MVGIFPIKNTSKPLQTVRQTRFLSVYPYLKKILNSLHNKRFRSVNSFDWDDVCARVYFDVFVLCASDKWLKEYAPQQVKRYLYVMCTNCALQEVKKIQNKNIQIDEEVIADNSNEISIYDVIELKGQEIEIQLIRMYEKLLGKRIVDEEYKLLLRRCSKVIAREIITEQGEYKTIDYMHCETNVIMSCTSNFS